MAVYKLVVETMNWYCECCGMGQHWRVSLRDASCGTETRLWSASRNDQFGGVLNEEDTDINFYGELQDLIKGMQLSLEALGHKVILEEEYDDSNPFEEYEEGSYCDV